MKKENAAQLFRHVCNLQAIAGLSSYSEALDLYKKLHRIEARQCRINEMECNGEIDLPEEETAKRGKKTLDRVTALLPGLKTIFINGDPRGYALKIDDSEQRELRDKGINLYSDWGGYGILAPDFN